jgi:hypothetical protein
MKMSKRAALRLGMFADVKEILDAALAANGGTYNLPTPGAAVHWRHRAYTFRKKFAESLPANTLSPYDRLTLPRLEKGQTEVHIVVREAAGTFTPNETAAPPSDDLLDEALALAEKLNQGDVL